MSVAVEAQVRGTRSYAPFIALIALGQVIIAIDFCVSSIALESIGRGFAVPPNLLSWVVGIFSLTYGGFLIIGGRVADLFGHRATCMLGLAMFGVGSLLCANAVDIKMLIAAHALAGLGGALLTPTTFSLINVALPDGPVRHRAYSVFGVTQGLSYMLGLYGGGLLISHFGWRSCFLVNMPLIIVGLALAWRQLPPREAVATRPRLDIAGAVLITAAMALLMFALSAFKSGFLSLNAILPLGCGIALMGVCVIVEDRARDPLMPGALFRHPNVVGADLACIAHMAAAGSTFVLLPLFLQRVFGFTAVVSGMAMLPYSLAVIAGGHCAGMAMARFSLRRCIWSGIAVFVAAVLVLAFSHPGHNAFALVVLPAMLAAAFGATIASLAVMAYATGTVPARDQGLASAVLMTCQQLGVALGVSAVFAVLTGAASTGGAFRMAFLVAGAFSVAAAISIYGLTAKAAPERCGFA